MSLQECVDFALENSYSVKQKILEKESNYIQLKARKTSIAPSIGANVGQNLDLGRSTLSNNEKVDISQSTTSFSVGMNMDIFQGLRTHHQIKSDQLNLDATLFDIEDAKENIELMVTAYYLQVLLNKEMLEVMKAQVILDKEQENRIKLLVDNGKNSDAELYAAKSTLASDQLSVVEAENSVRLSLLDLAQLMNYPEIDKFDIVTEGDKSNIDAILDKNIDVNTVVDNALNNRPAILAAMTRIEQAKRDIKVSQSGWYPTLGLSAYFGTGYYYRFNEIALQPNLPFGEQFRKNAGEAIGLTLTIPIFDKLSTYYNVKQQKIRVKSQELQLEETKRALIKNIEQAYVNAVAAKEKYVASQVAHTATLVAFQYEEVKYNAGSSTNYEFNDAKNKYLKAQSNLIQSKFDFLFRIKILEFYGKA
ncbi:MAG: TolC family protein [Bacteroidetes bacterium]|nr:TolC family protein [Bacteroidota bacterium]MCL1969077.1 TolC family protein [Bacteroidota bacterium]